MDTEAAHWADVLRAPAWDPGPLVSTRDTLGTASRHVVTVPVATTTALLTTVPEAFHAGITDVLLTALVVAAARWQRRNGGTSAAVLVNLEGHGREDTTAGLDLSHTVGWCTSLYPVRFALDGLDLDAAASGGSGPALERALKQVKERLRAVPGHGHGFGRARWLAPTTGAMLAAAGPPPALGFNYFGRFTTAARATPWDLVPGSTLGGDADPAQPLAQVIDVNAVTHERAAGPELTAHWTWAPALVADDAVRALAQDWSAVLDRLVAHVTGVPAAGGLTPSDVSLAGLTQSQIERLERTYRQRASRPSAR
jgi:non-ribosomal peptide synthase protein (TIGR01720 family)